LSSVTRKVTPASRKQQSASERSFSLHRKLGAIDHGETVLNRSGWGKFKGYSAGSQPAESVHPIALQVLQQAHYDTSGLRSKSRDESLRPGRRRSISFSPFATTRRRRSVPFGRGLPMTAHWGLPNPVKAQGSEAERHLAFADALRMLTNRIGTFVSLPFDKLSKLSLQKHLDEIRQNEPAATKQSA
jgi:arsenate reductase (thioredoxin)